MREHFEFFPLFSRYIFRYPKLTMGASPVKKGATDRSGHDFESLTERFLFPCWLLKKVTIAALDGQKLPQMSLVFLAHLGFHLIVGSTSTSRRLQHTSLALLIVSALINLSGYVLLIALYRHSVRNIFNRSLPRSIPECIPSFGAHLALLKPLEVIFRYVTASFRVLPDILVLGEVRCGTTTLCQHLSFLNGCDPPFCLWKHPELDHKETFYFVGHYLGWVDPWHYRMCFPLAIVKWFRQKVLRQPFFTYDGCAQYLTNPAAPYLIAQAYRDAGLPPPILVACVRDPVDQAVSWWRYENNAMLWGSSMGLHQWNIELRSPQYPPLTISGALEFSLSETVDEAYRMTEDLFRGSECKDKKSFFLPPWAMTWPGGQLTGIGRNGCYAANIQRYERVFSEVFLARGEVIGGQEARSEEAPVTINLQFVNVVPVDFLGDEQKLNLTLTSLMSQIDQRQGGSCPSLKECMPDVHASNQIKRNVNEVLTQASYLEPTQEDTERLEAFFSKVSAELKWDDSGRCSIIKWR